MFPSYPIHIITVICCLISNKTSINYRGLHIRKKAYIKHFVNMFQMADGEGSRKRNLPGEEGSQEEKVYCLIIFHIIFKKAKLYQII